MKQRTVHLLLFTIISSLFVKQCYSSPARRPPVKGVSVDSNESAPVKGVPLVEKPITAVLNDNQPVEEPAPAVNEVPKPAVNEPPKPVVKEEPKPVVNNEEPAPVVNDAPAEEPKKQVDKNEPKFSEPVKVTEAPSTSTTQEPKFQVLDGPIFKPGYPVTFIGPEGKTYKLPLSEAETEYLSLYGKSLRPKPRLNYVESGVSENTKKIRLIYIYMHIGNFLMYMGDDIPTNGKDD